MALKTIKPLDQIRVKAMSNINLTEALKLRKLTVGKLNKAAVEKQNHASQHIQLALNDDEAILHHTHCLNDALHPIPSPTETNSGEHDQPDVVKNRHHLSKTAARLKASLNKIWGENAFDNITIKHKHTGFSEHFELFIT